MVNKKLLTLAVAVAFVPAVALAGSAGANAADFTDIVTLLTDWLEGSLGTVIALATFLVGLGIGIMQQSIMAVVVGIAMAVAVANGGTIIAAITGAGVMF